VRLRLLVLSACLALCGGLITGTATPSGLTPSIELRAVPGLAALVAPGSTDLGAAGQAPVKVVLGLPLRDRSGLDALLHDLYTPGSARYHRFLGPAEFAARFGPDQATVGAVAAWAGNAGLSVVSVSANRTLVGIEGPAAAFDAAFGTDLHRFRSATGSWYTAPVVRGALPSGLAGRVDDIVGLDGLSAVVRPAVPHRAAQAGLPVSYGPQDLWTAYQAPSSQTGQGQTIAILAQGDVSHAQTDLVTFEKTYHLPQVPWTTVRTGPASGDLSGTGEWDLDTQYATGMAPGVSSLLVYTAPTTNDPDVLTEINRWVTDDRAPQASASWGECETQAQVTGLLAGGDKALAQAAAQGQTLFAASGDNGGFCSIGLPNGVPGGEPGLSFPASSPHAVAVGGTTLLTAIPRPLGEVAWVAGGGGVSLIETVPDYQRNAGGSFLALRRGAPDVAFDADELTGYQVISDGQTSTNGGTSASAPAWLGIWARAQGAHGGGLGFANPIIYREPASSFHDIVLGSAVPLVATPGWDYTTGRGTPDIGAFIAGA
jgi:pseudomonalisin